MRGPTPSYVPRKGDCKTKLRRRLTSAHVLVSYRHPRSLGADARYAGPGVPEARGRRWNRLCRELDETQELITELRARYERIAELDDLGPGWRRESGF